MPRNFSADVQPARLSRTYNEHDGYLEIPAILRRREPESAKRNLRVHFGNNDGCSSESCVGEGAVDIFKRNPSCYSFRQACSIFMHLNLACHFELIRSTLLNYSLKIYGLPECSSEDLYLSVYIFFDEVLGFECKLELCVALVENNDLGVIGVMLDSIHMIRRILEKATCLEGTGIKIQNNYDLDWILNGFCLTPAENFGD